MNKEQLHEFISGSDGNESNICQIYAIKDGKTVYDDCFHGFKTEDAMNVNSVSKGVMALLAGIALDRGCIKSLDQKVMDFFPDYTVKRGEKTIYEVTIKHLLTMTAPFKYKSEPWKKVCTSDDWTLTTLDYLGGRKGITGEFNGGKHAGKRIISEEYLKDMLAPKQKLGERMGYMNYGYLWYKPYDDREVYAAIGDCGNIICVNKEKNVAVGMTGTFKPRIFDQVEFMENYVLSAIATPF